jgi:hypothetical protein
MVPLLGFVALSVDVSATYAERQQLQNGADAAAMAIAQDCAYQDCGEPQETAQAFALDNSNDGEAVADVNPIPLPSTGRVTVTNEGVREHWFAPVLGVNTTNISTTARAGWGAPTGGIAGLPLVFSWCEFEIQTGGGIPSSTKEHTINLPKHSGAECNGPSDNPVPGGFGWVDGDIEDGELVCNVTSEIGERLSSDPGKNVPCSASELAALQGKTVLLPIYEDHSETNCDLRGDDKPTGPDRCKGGNNAWYEVYGYAAFKITGYFFGQKYQWNAPCEQPEHCIRGYFTKYVDTSSDYEYSPTAPNMGAMVVGLLP